VQKTEPRSKVMSLPEAVESFVRPGMVLHFGMAGSRPNAAIQELYRQFRARDPRFTLCSTGFGGPQLGLFLIDAGMADRVVAGFAGDQYPAPRPNRALRRQLDRGLVLEDWSLHTYLLRLRAAATNVPFILTASLAGSELAASRKRVIEVDGETVTLVPALQPDLSFLHGVVADEDGNVILSTPLGEAALGAAAAKNGAIVSVERIVSRDEFRELAGLPALPSLFVRAVCEASFGAHPSGVYADHVDATLSYGDDYEFMTETVEVLGSDDGASDAWADHWLAVHPDRYPERLGADRVQRLRDWEGVARAAG
jgi:acyl CoA:acetate/3-ketoacid CoA transferase alpha subunit